MRSQIKLIKTQIKRKLEIYESNKYQRPIATIDFIPI